jgi:hypothetical protein
MSNLAKRLFNGIVSDKPSICTKATPPAIATNNVVDIPEFMKRRSIELSQEYAERQAKLYARARMSNWQKLQRKFYNLFFEL